MLAWLGIPVTRNPIEMVFSEYSGDSIRSIHNLSLSNDISRSNREKLAAPRVGHC